MSANRLLTQITLGLLIMAGTAGAKYKIALSNIPEAAYNQQVTVDVTIEPEGTVDPLGGFDVTISYDPLKLGFVSVSQGDFLTDCEWEYFSYQHKEEWVPACCDGCTEVKRIRFLAYSDLMNGPYHPSCQTPTGVSQLAQVTFQVLSTESEVTPINFNWEPNEFPRSCGNNVLVDVSGDNLTIAENVYNNGEFNCSGPEANCYGARVTPDIDFYGGSVYLNSPGEFSGDDGTGQTIVSELKVRHEFELHDFSLLVSTGPDFDITDVTPIAGVTATPEVCGPGVSCYRISADGSTSWPPTGGGWTTVATITYELNHTCYCGNTYENDVIFSQYYMFDQYGSLRSVSVNQPLISSGYCGDCPHPKPSCPVLFTYNGTDFVEDNPLLTACEASGYMDAVTDYYQVKAPVVAENGQVRMQLREMEDEITYLESLKLFTIDHTSQTEVVCDVEGYVFAYEDIVEPLRAVDQNGVDQLALVQAKDDEWFAADEPGFLVVTFPNDADKKCGYSLSAEKKPPCTPIEKRDPNASVDLSQLTVEIMDANGNWVEIATIPPREHPSYEVFAPASQLTAGQDVITLRISWDHGYATDVINQFIPSYDLPEVQGREISEYSIHTAKATAKNWNPNDASDPLKLVKGDVLDLSFAVDEVTDANIKREYVVKAVGRYQPDYSVYTNLTPRGFQLYDAFPNPFNPTTTISYDLPQGSQVTLEVYNIMGQRVTMIIDEYQEAGHHTVTWNGRSNGGQAVASGVYFYRLEAGDFVASKRMMLLK